MDSKVPKDWMRYAQIDFLWGVQQIIFEEYYEIPCFHLQQAAEKAVKAIIVFHGVEPQRTHSILALLEELEQLQPVPQHIFEASFLTPFAGRTRYPTGIEYRVTKADYERAKVLAEMVLTWVEELLRDEE